MKKKENKNQGRIFGYLVSIIINLIILYAINNLLDWKIPALTIDFEKVIIYFNYSLSATILINIIFLTYDRKTFKAFAQMIANLFGIYALYKFFVIFPLNFAEQNYDLIARIVVVFAIFGTAIGVIIESIKFILSLIGEKGEE